MSHSEAYAEALRERWAATGREMPVSNLRQADYPASAEMIANPKGTAPGLALREGSKWLFAVPGVPAEMEYLLIAEVLPRLISALGEESVLLSRVLRTWGRSESAVGEMLDDIFARSTNPSIAFLASAGEIKVRISAKAPTAEAAMALIAPVEVEVRDRLGRSVFAVDDQTIEEVLLGLLAGKGWTIGTAESATGGLVASRLTKVGGASAVYRGTVVAYTTDLKRDLLGVSDLSHGVVSEETALAMAAGARKLLQVDVAVSVTGSAGPEAQEQPAGTMVIAVETPMDAAANTLRLPGDRERVRTYAATAALHHVRLAVLGEWWNR
jgi:nicotinamide-nucleotide amidase